MDIVFFMFSKYLEVIDETKQFPPSVVETKGCGQLLGLASKTAEFNWLELDLFKDVQNKF